VAAATSTWFVRNVRDAEWATGDKFGSICRLETSDNPFEQLGINIRVIEPGQPACLYHRESNQEDFLVLTGQCTLLVNEEERQLKAWDFVHLPPEVDHVFVGAGAGPCVILMVGARTEGDGLFYPVSELAQRYGASAEKDTPSAREAYSPFPAREPGKPAFWDSLPWT
jgi:uncharacterized cupin superfamily protein